MHASSLPDVEPPLSFAHRIRRLFFDPLLGTPNPPGAAQPTAPQDHWIPNKRIRSRSTSIPRLEGYPTTPYPRTTPNSNPNPNSRPDPQINRTQSPQTLTQFGPQHLSLSLSPIREAETAPTTMASTAEDEERGAAFYDEDEDEDDSDDGVDSEEEYDDDAVADSHAAAPPLAAATVARQLLHSSSSVSNPSPNPSASDPIDQNGGGGSFTFVASPDGKRQRILSPGEERKRLAVAQDESRRLFQKLWTDADEIAILQGFLEFTSQRGTTHANYQHDTGPFYDQIKSCLQVDFNKNQLVEKLRRLKKKYRNMVNRMASGKEFVFKSPHDKATFEIARKIWSPSFKRTRNRESGNAPNPLLRESSNLVPVEVAEDVSLSSDHMMSRPRRQLGRRSDGKPEMDVPVATPVVSVPVLNHTPCSSAPIPNANLIEQTVKSCLSPLFKELLQYAMGGPCAGVGAVDAGALLNPLLLNFPGGSGAVQPDEKWRKQQILELEVYLKRVELVREQIISKLEALRSMGGS